MGSLQSTKQRIKSVEATKKITNAMQLVSSAKLKKARNRFEGVRNITSDIASDMAEAIYDIADELNETKLITESDDDKTLFIVIASDVGLSGGYNVNVAKAALEGAKEGDEFVLIGKKVTPHLVAHNCHIVKTFKNHFQNLDYFNTYYVTQLTVDAFCRNEISQVKLVYTEFINSVTFKPKVVQVLPLDKSYDQVAIPFEKDINLEKLLIRLVRDYLNTVIYNANVEAHVCEYASSRMAMDNATDNAQELKEKLLLEYNRVRQANITQEISEIVAGADAL